MLPLPITTCHVEPVSVAGKFHELVVVTTSGQLPLCTHATLSRLSVGGEAAVGLSHGRRQSVVVVDHIAGVSHV